MPLMGVAWLACCPGAAAAQQAKQDQPPPEAVKTIQDAIEQLKRDGNDKGVPSLKTDITTLFGPDVYPAEALRAEEQGRVVVALSIDKQGRVTDCQLSQTSGSTSLDEVTCRQARTALFEPARDARGRAMASTFILPVRWQLPTGDELPSELDIARAPHGNWGMATELKIGSDGLVAACRPLEPKLASICAAVPVGKPYPQKFVRDGKPIAVMLVVRSSQQVTPAP